MPISRATRARRPFFKPFSLLSIAGAAAAMLLGGCSNKSNPVNPAMTPSLPEQPPSVFRDDVAFVRQHTDAVVLSDSAGRAQVLVAPKLQGRVFTSTADGPDGISFGWINRDQLASGQLAPHINAYGGEDRFWLGPEGGQYSIYFPPGAAFDFAHWQTPAPIDSEPWDVVSRADDRVSLRKHMALTNYSNTKLELEARREIKLVATSEAFRRLGMEPIEGVKTVAYESVNTITNTGHAVWRKETGLLSIWILGMFNASPTVTIAIPIYGGAEFDIGKRVNDDYFGKVPPERLRVNDEVIYFKGDARFRSKIGIPPARCRGVLGSYDPSTGVLTIVQFKMQPAARDYVNSAWKIQENPYEGDVANSYSDGPNDTGKQMGNFYELESSSPAAALAPGVSMTHWHRTVHFQGSDEDLDRIALAALGVSLQDIKDGLNPPKR